MKLLTSIVLASTLLLTGCESMTNEDAGTLTGAAAGAILGSQIGGGSGQAVATVGGALIGGMIGNSIGRSMDRLDRMNLSNALENNRINHAKSWRNPDSKVRYSVKPTRTYYQKRGDSRQPCREYVTTAKIGGKTETVYGTACRDQGGAWRIVN